MAAAERFDFVVFGSGFGGSITAMVLRRLGYSVALLEKARHPRFAIGESSTPFANLLLERLAVEYELPFLRSLSEWGSWQKSFPELSCGLKRGFTFFHHETGQMLDLADRRRQLLVAASPNDAVADTHWYRPEFDAFLVGEARKLGVTYFDNVEIQHCQPEPEWRLTIKSGAGTLSLQARFAIDASGAAGLISGYVDNPARAWPDYPATCAVYAHFRDVPLLDFDKLSGIAHYPPEQAAVHHVFEHGWIWVLRFNNGITSAGAALRNGPLPSGMANPRGLWEKLLARFPTLQRQFAGATAVTPFYSAAQLSFRRERATAGNWLLLPSAAGFVDPLLSTGFALTLLGIRRLGRLFQTAGDLGPRLRTYEEQTFAELNATADLVGALYARMHSFQEFSALALLYFAALSYTETAWRLGKEERARRFLLSDNSEFSRIRASLSEDVRAGKPIDPREVAARLEPWDVAGFGDLARANWYPVDFHDLLNARHKLGATLSEIAALAAKAGINPS